MHIYIYIYMHLLTTLDFSNILTTITLVFINLCSTAKNGNAHSRIYQIDKTW